MSVVDTIIGLELLIWEISLETDGGGTDASHGHNPGSPPRSGGGGARRPSPRLARIGGSSNDRLGPGRRGASGLGNGRWRPGPLGPGRRGAGRLGIGGPGPRARRGAGPRAAWG